MPYHVYKLFFLCDVIGGMARTSIETEAVSFFDQDRIPPLSLSRVTPEQVAYHGKVCLIAKPSVILDDVLKANAGGKSMFHLIWYILIGLISGVIARSVMHVHMTIFWTIVLGIIGSIIGGAVTHMFSRPTNERYHPAGLIFSTLGAILVLFICYKLKIHFPQVNPF
jgi:uncharacterized membrane protein YeaQ/YmgE (transglycosylase-associated protein family)